MSASADTTLTLYQFSAAELIRGIRAGMALSTSVARLLWYSASIETLIKTQLQTDKSFNRGYGIMFFFIVCLSVCLF